VSRLPKPGGDDDIWGNVLNDFLDVEHNIDGSLKRGSDIDAAQETANTAKQAATDAQQAASTAQQTAIDAKNTANTANTAAQSAYQKPGGGIPKSDLAALNIGDSDVAGISESKVVNLTTNLAAKVAKAGDTMTGKLTMPQVRITEGANTGYVLTSDTTGNAAWSSIPGITISGPSYLRGVSLSGLEFAPSVIPGTLNTNYFAPAAGDYAYFKSKGLTLVRLPFLWERIQPTLNGALDTTYKGYIDTAIGNARTNGMRVILDVHNFGRRYVAFPGGFTNDFTTSSGTWSGGSISGGQYISDPNSFFSSFNGGDLRNPVSPAPGYSFQADTYITSSQTGGSNFPALHVRVYDNGNNSYYQLSINEYEQKFKWSKVIAGAATAIGETAAVITVGTLYQVIIDINQASPGNVTITVNSSQIAQFPTDGALTGGRISLKNNFTKCAIDNVTLNVNGDTTGALNSGSYRVGDSALPTSAFADLWSRLATAYVSESTVWMYDLMNEPHDMPTPTTPGNYNTSSSVTLMYQAAINAVRGVDTHTYIAVAGDQYSGLQNFTSLYGANPTAWWSDPSGKTMVSFHYYFDTDHSGSYQTAWNSGLRTRIPGEVTPALQWAQNNNIPLFIGEYGVPNGVTSDAANWQQDENTFLGYLDTYGAYATHWAAGSHYTASTTLEPFTTGTPDYTKEVEQMPIVKAHLGQQINALSVNQGGTGLASPGIAGNVLTSDGTAWTSAVPSTGVQLEGTTAPPVTNTTGSVLGVATTAAHADHTHAVGAHDHSNSANGGNVYAPNLMTYSMQGHTNPTRVETAMRLFFANTVNLTAGNAYFTYFTPDVNITVQNFLSANGGTVPVGITLARLGLYTVDGSGNLACVARTASNASMWNSTNTIITQAIADDGAASPGSISSYALLRGTRYAFAFLQVGGGTAPVVAARQLPVQALALTLSPTLCTQISGQTDLASSYTVGSLSASTNFYYGALR
jgi:hypothetical protein